MAHIRKKSVDKISHYLSVLKADLEHHQQLNDLSLNISSENFFRDVLRYVRKWNDLENLNFFEPCAKSIDLVSKDKKTIIQVTSTTTSAKLYSSLEALKDSRYKNYTIEILYLIDIPNFSKGTVNLVKSEFGIDVSDVIFGREKLIKEIENLDQIEIEELQSLYFSERTMRYTENSVLQIACKNLIDKMPSVNNTSSNSTYRIEEASKKIKINKLNEEIKKFSSVALDYTSIILSLNNLDLEKLHDFVVKDIYRQCVISRLYDEGYTVSDLKNESFESLNDICCALELNMSEVVVNVHNRIKSELTIKDFNGIHIPWVILFAFFEICDICYLKGDLNDNAK
ncbi:SMEK domain-containing protein [Enterovibrio norvegicus]|uniref:SMEK domain-containing protein n=1 Tax=Enterovibrio norvegicus TaxID=188144 RepID=UPI00352C5DAC